MTSIRGKPSKMGRPKKEINKQQFETMCGIQATEEEICLVFSVSINTLNRWCKENYGDTFCKVFAQKRALGKASLRRTQWRMAEKSPTMAIWLGKQYLNQHDTNQVELSGRDGQPIQEQQSKITFYIPDNGRDNHG